MIKIKDIEIRLLFQAMEVGPPNQKSLKPRECFPAVIKERFVSMCQRDLTLMV